MGKKALFRGRLTPREIEMSARMEFVPKPGQSEGKDDFVDRCMADSEMSDSFPDSSQRAAVCNSAWRQEMAKKDEAEVFEVELFATGTWNGMEFNESDLRQIVNAGAALSNFLDVPLKFGHNDEQTMTDGKPAIGWVDSIKMVGDKIVGVFRDVPKIVREAISKKLYNKVSIELDFDVEHGGTNYPMVLTGVALLGADLPAVNTIEDLSKYMSLSGSRRLVFSTFKEEEGMNDDEKARLKAAEDEAKRLREQSQKDAEERAKFEREKAEFEARKKEADEKARKEHFARKKEELTTKLDAFVKAEVITPAYRDALLKGWEEKDTCVERVEFSIQAIEEGMPEDKRVKMHKKEEGKGKSPESKEEEENEDKLPSQVLLSRVQKLQVEEPKLTFSAATRRVLSADKKLAREYALENGEVTA